MVSLGDVPLKIFVTVGTSHYGFNRMLKNSLKILSLIENFKQVTVQYGRSDKPDFSELNADVTYIDMLSRTAANDLYQNSDFVFSHCGIGSIHNSLQYNRPTVIFSRLQQHEEFSDDHQLQIAKEIKRNPLILMVDEQTKESDIADFFRRHQNTEKKQVDLTNKQLAEFIVARLTEGAEV